MQMYSGLSYITFNIYGCRSLVERNGVAGGVSVSKYDTFTNGRIEYVQSYDRVPHGRGLAHVIGGGVGASSLVVAIQSGVGQGIHRTMEVYGNP